MKADKICRTIEYRLNNLLSLKEKRKTSVRLIVLRKGLESDKIIPWLNSGLRKYFIFDGCVTSEMELRRIVREMKQEVFPLIYEKRIKKANKQIDFCRDGSIRTMGHLRQVDKRLYEICQQYLTIQGKFDLDIVSNVFGATFYDGRLSIYKNIARRISGPVEFLNKGIVNNMLVRYSEENRHVFDFDKFIKHKKLDKLIYDGGSRNKSNSHHLDLFSLHRLSNEEKNKELRINMCREIRGIAKSGNIYPNELMFFYLQEILNSSFNKMRRSLKESELKNPIALVMNVFFTTLRDLDN